jgi:hypothetical protein
MEKFNEFEEYFINEALSRAAEVAEKEVEEAEKTGRVRMIFASGYFTMVAKEMMDKVSRNTERKTFEEEE